eukprot:jgi/Picre1/32325/NNA_007671.t1
MDVKAWASVDLEPVSFLVEEKVEKCDFSPSTGRNHHCMKEEVEAIQRKPSFGKSLQWGFRLRITRYTSARGGHEPRGRAVSSSGVIHQAMGTDETSVHLTISTYQRWTFGDLALKAVEAMLSLPALQLELPDIARESLPVTQSRGFRSLEWGN